MHFKTSDIYLSLSSSMKLYKTMNGRIYRYNLELSIILRNLTILTGCLVKKILVIALNCTKMHSKKLICIECSSIL